MIMTKWCLISCHNDGSRFNQPYMSTSKVKCLYGINLLMCLLSHEIRCLCCHQGNTWLVYIHRYIFYQLNRRSQPMIVLSFCSLDFWGSEFTISSDVPDSSPTYLRCSRSLVESRGWFTVKDDTLHYSDVTMGAIASQITNITIVYSTVYSDADQRKHQSSASLAFVWGIHRWPVNSPHKWPATRKMFPFDDVIMNHNTKENWNIIMKTSWASFAPCSPIDSPHNGPVH